MLACPATPGQLLRTHLLALPLLALALVLVAACGHASWNLLAKRAAHCRHFNWFYSAGSVVIYAPLAGYFLLTQMPAARPLIWVVLLCTGVTHIFYSEVLQRGYRAADMSLVYPVARGTGPLLSFFGALLILHEHPSGLAFAGALLVVAGVFVIAGGPRIFRVPDARTGLAWGTLIGCSIATYTLIDGYAVRGLAMAPVLVDYSGNLFRTAVLTPRALTDQTRVGLEWREYWRYALGVSVLGPMAYILVLYAMTLAPVSHIAPAREMSMMLGAYFGARLFHEQARRLRLLAAGLIVAGVAALTLG